MEKKSRLKNSMTDKEFDNHWDSLSDRQKNRYSNASEQLTNWQENDPNPWLTIAKIANTLYKAIKE